MARFRNIKPRLLAALRSEGWEAALDEFSDVPPEQLVSPLASFLIRGGLEKHRAAYALGMAVSRMAGESMEQARVFMRRLIWNLCEESGTLGWGSPEAMAEILAADGRLAREYNRVLISYSLETGNDDNFIEHTPLRRGAVWGAARLAQARPELAGTALPAFIAGLKAPQETNEAPDPQIQGYSAWGLGCLGAKEAVPHLEPLAGDDTEIELFRDKEFFTTTVGALVRETLERLA